MKNGSVPVIDIQPLVVSAGEARSVGEQLDRVCRENGFFYIVGHGVEVELQRRLEHQSRAFFALDVEEKMRLRMALGGKAWRGYFPLGEELTSGRPDLKEGLYFGAELSPQDPRVMAGLPLHGANLFPESMPELASTVREYLDAMTRLGHTLMSGLALGLGLERSHFQRRFMQDPLILFRIFHYPPPGPPLLPVAAQTPLAEPAWGVGEHTDYGVLTILKQDEVGGLEVKSGSRWLDAPPIANSFVCNIGDMLERMTGGLYRSTPHRVRNTSGRGRLSFPFFFDPDWTARIEPVVAGPVLENQATRGAEQRWDGANLHGFSGTYGDYVLSKVSKVFPGLAADSAS